MKKRIGMVITAMGLPGEKGHPRYDFLAKLFAENKFEVDVILSTFQHYDKKQRNLEELQKLDLNYNIIFIKEPGYKKNIDVRRIISHKIFSKRIKEYLENNKNKYDILYCLIPDNFVAMEVSLFGRKNNIPVVIDVEDLWPEAMKMVFDIPFISNLLFYPFSKAAKLAYQNCSGIIGSSDEYRDRPFKDRENNIPKETVYVGSELKVYDEGIKIYSEEIPKEEEEFWIIYAGNIGTSYDLKTLLLASKLLYDRGYENIKTKILGTGTMLEELKEISKDFKNVEFLGHVLYPKMAAYLSKSDVCINSFVKKAPQSIVTKIGDYLASGHPMINTCSSIEFRNKVENDKFGINIEAEDPEILVNAILYFYNNKDICVQMGNNARKIAEEQFDRPQSYKKIVNLINKLLME